MVCPTTTHLVLNKSQQHVVDVLRALPNPHLVRIKTQINVLPNGVTTSDMEIHGGFSGGDEPTDCEACGREMRRSYWYATATFKWHNNKFNDVHINHDNIPMLPYARGTMRGVLGWFERLVKEMEK